MDGKTYPRSEEWQAETARLALELRSTGHSQRQIARVLGVSQPTVHRLLRDWRLER